MGILVFLFDNLNRHSDLNITFSKIQVTKLLSLLLIALSLLDCLTAFSALTLLVRSVFRCLLNKDRR